MGELPSVLGALIIMLGAGVEGRGGGDSDVPPAGSPLLGDVPLSFRLASYSKVRLGLGRGFTGVPPGVSGAGGSGLPERVELTLNLCLSLESLSEEEEEGGGASGSVATEQILLRLLVHALSRSSIPPMVKDFCLALSGA